MTGRKLSLRAANASALQLKSLFNRMGNLKSPRGEILQHYRTAHRGMKAAYGNRSDVYEVLRILETSVRISSNKFLNVAADRGFEDARIQLEAYGVPFIRGSSNIHMMFAPWLSVLEQQIAKAGAMYEIGEELSLIIGDDSRRGILSPAAYIAAGTLSLAAVLSATWAASVLGSTEREGLTYYKQAIAAIDDVTTDCCLRVHGQYRPLDKPFTLDGTPRFARNMQRPPFHYNCRTSQALVRAEYRKDDLTVKMQSAGKAELKKRKP